jgi:hypothetical protein
MYAKCPLGVRCNGTITSPFCHAVIGPTRASLASAWNCATGCHLMLVPQLPALVHTVALDVYRTSSVNSHGSHCSDRPNPTESALCSMLFPYA